MQKTVVWWAIQRSIISILTILVGIEGPVTLGQGLQTEFSYSRGRFVRFTILDEEWFRYFCIREIHNHIHALTTASAGKGVLNHLLIPTLWREIVSRRKLFSQKETQKLS